jgi:superfamily II DNA or RNA helicase
MKLRDYQTEANDAIKEAFKDHRSTLMVLPTGMGKTVCFAHLIKDLCNGDGRALVMAHRDELIGQAFRKIRDITGEEPDIEMAEKFADLDQYSMTDSGKKTTVVTSVQTQNARRKDGKRMTRFDPSEFKLMVIDEGHHAPAPSYREVAAHYQQNPELRLLGCTATPDRADEKALGQVFDSVAFDMELPEAIDAGWLVPIRQQMVTVDGLDFSGCRTTAGDLNQGDLDAILKAERMLHKVATPTLDIIGDRKTLVFASSVAHAERLCEIFNRHRPDSAIFIHGGTPKLERRQMLKDYDEGRYQILCNCDVATEGFDIPSIEVVVPKPTKSRSKYAQMIGRATRPHESCVPYLNDIRDAGDRQKVILMSCKPKMLILDFHGNAGRHKLISSADILGGRYDDAVRERAYTRARDRGGAVNMTEELKAALNAIEAEEKAHRKAVMAAAKWKTRNVSPFDVLDLPQHRQERTWNIGREPSAKMKGLLIKAGIEENIVNSMGWTEAHQLVGEIMRRYKLRLCSYKQARLLWKYGEDAECSMQEASRKIDAIKANGWKPLTHAV